MVQRHLAHLYRLVLVEVTLQHGSLVQTHLKHSQGYDDAAIMLQNAVRKQLDRHLIMRKVI